MAHVASVHTVSLFEFFHNYVNEIRAQPDWAYEFLDQTGPDTQICRKGPAGPD